jgi:hypothetical protein
MNTNWKHGFTASIPRTHLAMPSSRSPTRVSLQPRLEVLAKHTQYTYAPTMRNAQKTTEILQFWVKIAPTAQF